MTQQNLNMDQSTVDVTPIDTQAQLPVMEHFYTIQGEGKGGIAGFAKGGADVTLTADGADTTVLRYAAKADVGGKIAQLGSRLIESTSKKLAGQFFSTFGEKVGG